MRTTGERRATPGLDLAERTAARHKPAAWVNLTMAHRPFLPQVQRFARRGDFEKPALQRPFYI